MNKSYTNSYTIVTTPMCEKILQFAGINDYKVNKNPDKEEGDLAILLSENKTKMPSLNIKLNTFSQIIASIKEVSKYNPNYSNSEISEEEIKKIFKENHYNIAIKWINKTKKRKDNELKLKVNSKVKIKVKVYSKFLKDIVEDMGYKIDNEEYSYLIYPDYMELGSIESGIREIENSYSDDIELIEIPTHSNVPKDPIKRAELRYSILNKAIT